MLVSQYENLLLLTGISITIRILRASSLELRRTQLLAWIDFPWALTSLGIPVGQHGDQSCESQLVLFNRG